MNCVSARLNVAPAVSMGVTSKPGGRSSSSPRPLTVIPSWISIVTRNVSPTAASGVEMLRTTRARISSTRTVLVIVALIPWSSVTLSVTLTSPTAVKVCCTTGSAVETSKIPSPSKSHS